MSFIAGTLWGCDVDQTRQGELPDVDVDVSADPGELPAFEVNWADIDVGTRTETVEVPKVVVVTEEAEVEVPYIDIDMPDDGSSKTERTITAEVEVVDEMHTLEIEQVVARDRRLYVISALQPTGEPLDDQRVRVSDHLALNAPDLELRHIVIGERPDRSFNDSYAFVGSEQEAMSMIGDGATVIYSD